MISFAEKEDISQVAKIEKELFSLPWSEQNFLEALCNPSACIWVAKQEDTVMGYLLMYCSIDEGEITNVAVAPDFRKKGIGTSLLDAAKEYALKNEVTRIVLEVRISNDTALSLYQKNGFQALGIRKGFYEKPREDAMIMAWEK